MTAKTPVKTPEKGKSATTTKTPVAQKTPSKVKETPAQERDTARSLGLSLVQYRIVKAMSDGKEYSYRDIEAKTGYYKNLTPTMRKSYEGSLCHMELVKEAVKEIDGKEKIMFTLTAKGLKLINGKPSK